MFYGTKLSYKLLYFFTAMSPAYFLFLLQLSEKFKDEFPFSLWKFKIEIYELCFFLIVVVLGATLYLKFLLKRQFIRGLGTPVLANQLSSYSKTNIEERNGNVTSFLLGNVIPAVLIIESSIWEAIMVFVILQFIIFILVIKSSDIFPNFLLIIFGLDLCKLSNGEYILIFNGEAADVKKVFQIGNVEKSKLYITSYKK